MTIDELAAFGLEEMDDPDIRAFLACQSVGVLGLPAGEDPPTMRPLSYWFDGERALYFQYVLPEGSRKVAASDLADQARFLVFRTETEHTLRSVLVTGPIEEVPPFDRVELVEDMDVRQRPAVLTEALDATESTLYRMTVEDWSGVASLGLPAAFEEHGDAN